MSSIEPEIPSTRPYLIRALHEWCVDNGYSPYIAVQVDGAVRVPMEFVKNGEIVLNVSPEATSALKLGNEYLEFKARFGGVAREIVVPVSHVIAIYARENGQGMAFPAPAVSGAGVDAAVVSETSAQEPDDGGPRGPLRSVPNIGPSSEGEEPDPPTSPGRPGGRPQLKRVK
jgi:stringent starvation protein B